MKLINDTFINNYAKDLGSAVKVYATSGTVVENSTFKNNYNSRTVNYGGALSFNGGTNTVRNSSFINNTARYAGGAIYSANSGNLYIYNSKFYNNTSPGNGGAIK